MYQMPLLNKF